MKSRCPTCKGTGRVIKEKMTCPACLGIGKTSFSLGGKNEGETCKKCNGTGKITIYETCPTCKGAKVVYYCKKCKRQMDKPTESGLCHLCEQEQSPVVHALKPPIDPSLVRKGMFMLSRVEKITKVGVFVSLAPDYNVLIRERDVTNDYAWDIGEEVIVKITHISEQGKLFGVPISLKDYVVRPLRGQVRKLMIADLSDDMIGSFISIKALVVSVLQTSGPTRFTLVDPSGTINAAAFIKPGERAFPEIVEDMVVAVFGEVTTHQNAIQIEIKDMEPLETEESETLLKEIEKAIDQKATPEDIKFLVKSPTLNKLKKELKKVAKRIRKAIYVGQPIYIRHHADADGTVAGFSVQYALQKLMEKEGFDPETIRLRIKRLPNKPPFYDVLDVTKDLDFALEDQTRFGDKLPLFVCLDFGSSNESLLAYKQIKSLDLEILTVDHHFPDPEIRKLLDAHVNPYHVEGGYELSAGMLGYELARFINPDITEELSHLPAIAGIMDKVDGEEQKQYLEIAKKKGYSIEELEIIGQAIDFEVYQLRFSEGSNVLKIIFGIESNPEWHNKMANLLGKEAIALMETAKKNALPHCNIENLENGAILITIDVELYTHRFTYPNPGKLTGLIFDHFCNENPDKAVVTLGEGPDFIILRSKGLSINFPELIKQMQNNIPETGITGGGHEVVGSFKFYEGEREKVHKYFINALGSLPVLEQENS